MSLKCSNFAVKRRVFPPYTDNQSVKLLHANDHLGSIDFGVYESVALLFGNSYMRGKNAVDFLIPSGRGI